MTASNRGPLVRRCNPLAMLVVRGFGHRFDLRRVGLMHSSMGGHRLDVEYLNTDLVIESRDDLSLIVEEFGEEVMVLDHRTTQGRHRASFETQHDFLGADEAISHLCLLVENLSSEARNGWDRCVSRVFDLGFQGGTSLQCYRTELRVATISRVSAIGAGIIVTVYPTGMGGEHPPATEQA